MKGSRVRRWIDELATILYLLALNIGACVFGVLFAGFNFCLWTLTRSMQSSDIIRTASRSVLADIPDPGA
jgi:hypothetical protein